MPLIKLLQLYLYLNVRYRHVLMIDAQRTNLPAFLILFHLAHLILEYSSSFIADLGYLHLEILMMVLLDFLSLDPRNLQNLRVFVDQFHPSLSHQVYHQYLQEIGQVLYLIMLSFFLDLTNFSKP